MRQNIGIADRVLRLILGLALTAAALFPGLTLFADPLWFWGAIGIATILIVTATVRLCPLYALLGVSTCKAPR